MASWFLNVGDVLHGDVLRVLGGSAQCCDEAHNETMGPKRGSKTIH